MIIHISKLNLIKKRKIIDEFLELIIPKTIIDFGANTGLFSRIAGEKNIFTISCDFDPYCVELNYLEVKNKKEKNILPLFLDLTNPSPDLGWHNRERDSFLKRKKVDAVMALALIHHLSIYNNVPFERLVLFFSELSEFLIIEFVPKEDIQVQCLLANRKDIYINYDESYFEKTFTRKYDIIQKQKVTESGRLLYLMKTKITIWKLKVLKKIPIHPHSFCNLPILFLYTNNISMLAIKHIFRPVIWSIAGVVIIWFVLNLFLKNRYKSSAITSLITVLFFSYGHIIIGMNKFPEDVIGISSDLYLSLNYLLIIGILSYMIIKFFKNFLSVTGYLNLIGFTLLFYPLYTIFINYNP